MRRNIVVSFAVRSPGAADLGVSFERLGRPKNHRRD